MWKPSFRSDDNGTLMALCAFNAMFELGNIILGLLYLDCWTTIP